MKHIRTNEQVTVHTDGSAGPYIMVPPDQVASVQAELRAHGITSVRDHAGINEGGATVEEVINLGTGTNVEVVQKVLDDAEFAVAQALVMGTALSIKVRNRPWGIMLRPLDEKPDPTFSELHGKRLSEADVRDLIPDFAELTWTDHQAVLPHNRRESRAISAQHRVALVYPADLDPNDVKAEFTTGLANAL